MAGRGRSRSGRPRRVPSARSGGVVLVERRRAEPAAREPAAGHRGDAQRELGGSPPSVAVGAAADEHAAPAVERVARARRGSTRWPSARVSASASGLGGVGVLARTGVQRPRVPALEQLGDRGKRAAWRRAGRARAWRRARRARGSRPARRSGASCQPSPDAGASRTPTGRSTRSTGASCASASASHAGEAIRQQRRSSASKSSGCASAQRESCSPRFRRARVGARVPAGGRGAATQTAGSSRSIGSWACARRSASSSARCSGRSRAPSPGRRRGRPWLGRRSVVDGAQFEP